MKNGIEIRWHGRGGQGAKTAALLLADVAFKTGKHVQGFPEYGPERMGAPITAYNRISSDVIRVHSNIYDPDFVAVVDETLLHTVDVTAGLKKEGAIIVNTAKSKEEIMPPHTGLTEGMQIFAAGTSKYFKTGEWRNNTPVYLEDNCKQCLLCAPVCPDSSIPVKDQKRGAFDLDHCKGCGICAKVCPF